MSAYNFFKLSFLPTFLKKETDWSESTIEHAVEMFHSAVPVRKRTVSDSSSFSSEEEVVEQYLKRGKTKRRPLKEDQPPQWAIAFMKSIEQNIGGQAVMAFKETELYQQMCQDAVKERIDSIEKRLEKELQPAIEKRLEEQLKVPIMQRLEQERCEALMKPFQLRFGPPEDNEGLIAMAKRN